MSLVIYGARHLQALFASVGRLVRNPFATLLTVLVIALALALPLGLKLLVSNVQIATGGFANAVDMSVFLKMSVPLAQAEQLAANARERTGIESVELISSDRALEEFREYSGFGVALEALQSNPLPHVLRIRPTAAGSSTAAMESLRRYFAAWPEVDLVQIDSQWVQRLEAILQLLRRVFQLAAIVLGLGVLAVIGNTIRLEILNRRAEIEITKLVGGSNAFVRRPFLYIGTLYGLLGAALACAILIGATAALDEPVTALAQLYGSRFVLSGPSSQDVGALLLAGLVLGWIGAWIAAGRHLRDIEPRA